MQKPKAQIHWPSPSEYDWALQQRQSTFHDTDIRNGKLQERGGRPVHLNGGGCPYICVYRVDNWIIRCFTQRPQKPGPPQDIPQRYRAITTSIKRNQQELPFLVPNIWLEPGLNVNGSDLPCVKVPYITDSRPLGDYLSDHYSEGNFYAQAAQLEKKWLEIVQRMESLKIAHGDLDLSNILVRGSWPQLSLYLIDYDGMYIPEMAGTGISFADNGHAHFQPVQAEKQRQFGPEMDRFSALIIYLSLCALAKNPALWENCEANENRLLLGAEDFRRLGLSKNYIRLLQERDNTDLQICLQELQDSAMKESTPRALSEILKRSPYVLRQEIEVSSEPPAIQYRGRALAVPLEPVAQTAEIEAIRRGVPQEPVAGTPQLTPSFPATTPVLPVGSTVPVDLADQGQGGIRGRVILFLIFLCIIAGILIWWFFIRHQPPTPQTVVALALYSGLPYSQMKKQKDRVRGSQNGEE